jgi:protein-tyrosine-phosphatase
MVRDGGCRMRVLFICTGNSARSQIAEALLRQITNGRVEVHSAGGQPKNEIHPMAREAVRRMFNLEMTGQSPKSLDRFLGQEFDYVISVCDRADAACPIFPGDTERIHWSLEDPAAVEGTEEEKRRAFETTATDLMRRIRLWTSLPTVAEKAGLPAVGLTL